MVADNTIHRASGGHGLEPVLGACPHDGGGAPTRAVVGERCLQGHDGLCDVIWRAGRGVLGACRPLPAPGGSGSIIAFPPLVEPACRAGQLPTDVLDLVVGEIVVESLVTTMCGTLGQRYGLYKLRLSCAELVLLSVRFVLDVLTHELSCVRITPGVDESTPVQVARLAPPAPGPPGAGVGVESKPGLRDHALDARERSATQGFPLRER